MLSGCMYAVSGVVFILQGEDIHSNATLAAFKFKLLLFMSNIQALAGKDYIFPMMMKTRTWRELFSSWPKCKHVCSVHHKCGSDLILFLTPPQIGLRFICSFVRLPLSAPQGREPTYRCGWAHRKLYPICILYACNHDYVFIYNEKQWSSQIALIKILFIQFGAPLEPGLNSSTVSNALQLKWLLH